MTDTRRTRKLTTASFFAVCLCLSGPLLFAPHATRGATKEERAKAAADAKLVAQFAAGEIPADRTADQLQADADHVVNMLTKALATNARSRYRADQTRDQLQRICHQSLRAGSEPIRRAFCKALAQTLVDDPNAPATVESIVFHLVQDYGGPECVGPLARMLADDDPARREMARSALQLIVVPAGTSSAPGAGDKLRQALFAAVDPNWQIALMNTLGARREPASVDWLTRMLKERNPAVAAAAAAALGEIATPDAVATLERQRLLAAVDLRRDICDALLACADRAADSGDKVAAATIWRKLYENPTELKIIRIAALRAMVAAQGSGAVGVVVKLLAGDDRDIKPVALALAREVPGRAATEALVGLLAKTTDEADRIELIDVLGDRGDTAAREAVLSGLRGRRWSDGATGELRASIIRAMGGVGTEADAMVLVRLAVQAGETDPNERDLARASVRNLSGEKVNAALLAGLGEPDPAVRKEVVHALAGRDASEATMPLIGLRADRDLGVRYAALRALERVGDERALLPLVNWFCEAKSSSEALSCQRAMAGICQRTDATDLAADSIAKAFQTADAKTKCALMASCGNLACEKALETLAMGVADPNEIVQESALKALAHSPEPGAAEQLLHVARTAKRDDQKTLALSGYIRLSHYLPLPTEKKLWAFVQIMDLARTAEQKTQALKCLADIRSAGALAMAMESVEDPQLASAAEYAACRIAVRIYATSPQEVVDAMSLIIRRTASADRLKDARYARDLAQRILDRQKPAAKK